MVIVNICTINHIIKMYTHSRMVIIIWYSIVYLFRKKIVIMKKKLHKYGIY